MVVVKDHQRREPSMGDITTIGLDLAKSVFQVHAVDEAGTVMMRKRLDAARSSHARSKTTACRGSRFG
jgi:carotenoid cleavage dioxygenase-like enzyme